MKKILSIIMAVLIIGALLTSCGSSGSAPQFTSNTSSMNDEASVEGGYGKDGSEVAPQADNDDNGSGLTNSNISTSFTEKIIYYYSAQIETTTFDDSIDKVNMLRVKYGAFIENSSIRGNSYGRTSFRSAEYTLRVPVENFTSLTGDLSILGNVSNESTNAQNITAPFVDSEVRLDTYMTEESRLLSMLERADTIEDMITIESRLSDVRYQIESITSTLRNWQNQVDYSTVSLYISEVEELTDPVSAQRTYWGRIGDGLSGTIKGIGDFFKSFFMILVVAMPIIITLGVIAIIVIIIVRVVNKRNKKNNNQNNTNNQ